MPPTGSIDNRAKASLVNAFVQTISDLPSTISGLECDEQDLIS